MLRCSGDWLWERDWGYPCDNKGLIGNEHALLHMFLLQYGFLQI